MTLQGQNVLVSASGQHVRIADLGASTRLRGQQTGAGELAGQLIGTVAFTAPEVLRGEHYGRSADMWSVGCCVLEMATARFPWDAQSADNHFALIFRVANASAPPPISSSVPPVLKQLALLCLCLAPDQRPTSRALLSHQLLGGSSNV